MKPNREYKNNKTDVGVRTLFAFPPRMKSLANAVTQTLEELEVEEFMEAHIHTIREDELYHVTFQMKANGNKNVILSVEYRRTMGPLLDDESWEGNERVLIVERNGTTRMAAKFLLEFLAITLDEGYFDSDDEDSDDETISSPP
jgi:hypothetical protein